MYVCAHAHHNKQVQVCAVCYMPEIIMFVNAFVQVVMSAVVVAYCKILARFSKTHKLRFL